VIRAPADRGVLYLIDDRFARTEVRSLLPAWWRINEAAYRVCSSNRRASCNAGAGKSYV